MVAESYTDPKGRTWQLVYETFRGLWVATCAEAEWSPTLAYRTPAEVKQRIDAHCGHGWTPRGEVD